MQLVWLWIGFQTKHVFLSQVLEQLVRIMTNYYGKKFQEPLGYLIVFQNIATHGKHFSSTLVTTDTLSEKLSSGFTQGVWKSSTPLNVSAGLTITSGC